MTDQTQSDEAGSAFLKGESFVVEEGALYRTCRTGAIWMNKLFFGAVALWAVWILWGMATDVTACAGGLPAAPDQGPAGDAMGDRAADDPASSPTCNVLLTQTSLYLGAMAIITFLLSLAFGALGLVVGKRVLVASQASEEVGARRAQEKH